MRGASQDHGLLRVKESLLQTGSYFTQSSKDAKPPITCHLLDDMLFSTLRYLLCKVWVNPSAISRRPETPSGADQAEGTP